MLGAVGTKKTTAASREEENSQDLLLGTKGRPTGRLEEMLMILLRV